MSPPIVIIGGGTAGCTVAASLASRTTRDIVLVEPGGVSPFDDHPAFLDVLARGDLTRVTDVRLSSASLPRTYLEAAALGGGSAVNGMILSGEPPADLVGLTGLAGRDDMGPVGRALLEAGGEPTRLWWNGGRWNPGRAAVHLAEEGRMSIVAESVQSIAVGTRSTAVRTVSREIEASLVVMCAGAIGTPALLLASGLAALNGAIGVGLQNHPAVSFALHLRPDPSPARVRFDATVIRRDRGGAGRDLMFVGYERASAAHARLGLLSAMVMEVESRGTVSMSDGVAVVDFNVLSTEGDRWAMRDATSGLISLVGSPSMVDIVDSVSIDAVGTPVGAVASLSDDDLDEWIRDHVEVVSHATSSCSRAVDSTGRLIGTDAIWVADASVLPSVPNCTPAAPVTMEARRIAACIRDFLSSGADT